MIENFNSGMMIPVIPTSSGGSSGGSDFPTVTEDDNGKVLGVVDGVWDKMDVPGEKPWKLIADETPDVDTVFFTWKVDAEGNSFDFTDILIVSDSASVLSTWTRFFAVETTSNTTPPYASMYKGVTSGKQMYIYVQKIGSKALMLCGGQDQSMLSTINTPSDDHYTVLTAYFQSGWKAGYNFKAYGR